MTRNSQCEQDPSTKYIERKQTNKQPHPRKKRKKKKKKTKKKKKKTYPVRNQEGMPTTGP